MGKETEAWENDQVLDPERKLAEIESAPPSEREHVPTAADNPSAPVDGKQTEAPAASTPSEEQKPNLDPSEEPSNSSGPDSTKDVAPETTPPS